jgi:hypothetical protein
MGGPGALTALGGTSGTASAICAASSTEAFVIGDLKGKGAGVLTALTPTGREIGFMLSGCLSAERGKKAPRRPAPSAAGVMNSCKSDKVAGLASLANHSGASRLPITDPCRRAEASESAGERAKRKRASVCVDIKQRKAWIVPSGPTPRNLTPGLEGEMGSGPEASCPPNGSTITTLAAKRRPDPAGWDLLGSGTRTMALRGLARAWRGDRALFTPGLVTT